MAMNKYLSIITLNVNGLNAPIKRHRIAEWIRKHDPHICCLQETHLRTKDHHRLKVKGWKQIFQANGQEKKAGVAILISDKIDFKKRAIKRDPEGHFIILKGRIHQEDINIVNIYAPNIGAPKYIKKILEDFKKDIDSNTIIVGDFNTPLSKMDRSSKQNINKDIVALNNTLDEMDLTDIYRALHPKEAKYTFFSNAHGTFSKVDHMIGHKMSLNKFKNIEIIPNIFF
jgi:exonuclease III